MAGTVSAKSTKGSTAGAVAWLYALSPTGVAPKDWRYDNAPSLGPKLNIVVQTKGPYTLNVSPQDRAGSISWEPNGTITFKISTSNMITDVTPGLTNKGLPKGESPGTDTKEVGPGPDIANAIDSVPKFLEAISNKSLWERVGIGAAGVVLVALALIFTLRKGLE